MPRVTHVKSARKANPVAAVGESYYWWKFRYGGKRYSKTYPKQSQLTQSAYKGRVYDLIDRVNQFEPEPGEEAVVEEFISEIVDEICEIRDECQESLDNMPESLQYSPTGELLQERIDACDAAEGDISCMQEPDQWQEVRDAQEEHDEWVASEPEVKPNGSDEHDQWEEDEPEVEEYEYFDATDIANAVEEMMI